MTRLASALSTLTALVVVVGVVYATGDDADADLRAASPMSMPTPVGVTTLPSLPPDTTTTAEAVSSTSSTSTTTTTLQPATTVTLPPAPTVPAITVPQTTTPTLPVDPPLIVEGVEQWRPLVESYAWNVDVALCLMWYESRGDPNAQNPSSGASGLMQVLPSWADNFGVMPADLFDPVVNLNISFALYVDGGWSHWSPWNRGECH
jgi:hypothetical protein